MSKEKLYFRSIDDTTCRHLEWHFDDARDEELETIKLIKVDYDSDLKKGVNDLITRGGNLD